MPISGRTQGPPTSIRIGHNVVKPRQFSPTRVIPTLQLMHPRTLIYVTNCYPGEMHSELHNMAAKIYQGQTGIRPQKVACPIQVMGRKEQRVGFNKTLKTKSDGEELAGKEQEREREPVMVP